MPGKSGYRAICKECGKELQGLVARLKHHKETCFPKQDESVDAASELETDTKQSSGSKRPNLQDDTKPGTSKESHQPFPKIKKRESMNDFVTTTSSTQKAEIDTQIARYIYATNTPFAAVEHPEFIKLITLLRPGYRPPNRDAIGGKLLDEVKAVMLEDCRKELEGKDVSMALDGWSNLHNEPVVCVSVTSPDGHCYLTDTIDTSGNAHTADYLKDLARNAIQSTEMNFKCRVASFVTDNASNMVKMRKNLEADDDSFLFSYGCAAHYLNLLAKDVEVSGIKDHVVRIMKYFRNNHLPAAWYKSAGGKMLSLPQEVRWNTLADCLQSYMSNWSVLLKVCEEHRNEVDGTIADNVRNLGIKRNAEDYLTRMKPIAVALDKVQRNTCVISEAVEVWLSLLSDLKGSQPQNVVKKVEQRMKQSLTATHYLSNILDPRYQCRNLSKIQIDCALQYLAEEHPTCLSTVVSLRAKAKPFEQYMFSDDLMKNISPLAWWKSQTHLSPEMQDLTSKLLSAVASSAGVERIFSTFGFVHSKTRNRLGTEKAGKLVFIYKLLNNPGNAAT